MPNEPKGSASESSDKIRQAVARFGSAVGIRLRAGIGQPEATLTSPVENLLTEVARALALTLTTHPEATDASLGVRPDLAVDIDGAPVGVVELKKNGRGVPDSPDWGDTVQTRRQWKQLQKLPNVLYTDGTNWAVYHYGKNFARPALLAGDLKRAGSDLRPADEMFETVLRDFLYWQPSPPRRLHDLIRISAGLCELLRDEVRGELKREQHEETERVFLNHQDDWREWLFPDIADEEFADAYAQTITFGLLLARRSGIIFEGLEIPDIGDRLAKRHLLVGRALSILTARPDRARSMEERSIALQTMRRVIGAADWSRWREDKSYHSLYEDFLGTYDSSLRRQSGSYYTPAPVADFMTRFVDDVLAAKLDLPRGLADRRVVVLDPAMGTGTFLQSVLHRVAEKVAEEHGDVPASLRELLTRLIGFERQIGPYAVAELKLDQALESHRAEAKGEDYCLYVTDTLDDPANEPFPGRGYLYKPLADSRRRANDVKLKRDVTVVIGNPPYLTRARSRGKWILAGRPSLLDDFRSPGDGRFHHKLHDLSVYFWRWALWKSFQSNPQAPAGVVAFISTHAYLDGPGFAGMRAFLRREADAGWIIDLSAEGHRSDVPSRVFPEVQQPVCIGIFARQKKPLRSGSAEIRYLSLAGSRTEKFSALRSVSLKDSPWSECPSGSTAPFRPLQSVSWRDYPSIDDLFPYSSLGVTSNRSWVYAISRGILRERWRNLIRADRDRKRTLMKETRDRTIDKPAGAASEASFKPPISQETSPDPLIEDVGFRSFDRQFLIADARVVDFLRVDLWHINSDRQVYLVTQLREQVTNGPAVVFSEHIPDTHYFSGRGGRVLPLFRDSRSRCVNVPAGLLDLLRSQLRLGVEGTDVMAYVAGVLAHGGYTTKFREELRQPGVRVPLTAPNTISVRSS